MSLNSIQATSEKATVPLPSIHQPRDNACRVDGGMPREGGFLNGHQLRHPRARNWGSVLEWCSKPTLPAKSWTRTVMLPEIGRRSRVAHPTPMQPTQHCVLFPLNEVTHWFMKISFGLSMLRSSRMPRNLGLVQSLGLLASCDVACKFGRQQA